MKYKQKGDIKVISERSHNNCLWQDIKSPLYFYAYDKL